MSYLSEIANKLRAALLDLYEIAT